MTRFSTHFNRTAAKNLNRQFGESIGYFNRAGDPVRNITGMILRDAELIDETGVPGQATVIRVENDAATGISATEIDTGGDEIEFALRVGETKRRKAIVSVLSTENGLVRFLVQ